VSEKTYRVVQWATGNIGTKSLRAVIDHPNFELVGLYVHSPDKAGKDAGELCGAGTTGVIATNSISDVLALDADCVLYMQQGCDFDDVCRILESGANIVISGGTGSGKTTLLNAMTGFIGAAERIITIEETAELRLRQPHVVRLEARTANAEGMGAITVRELVRAALRMRPDRLVVGEVRGAEALDLLQALNTGHEGSLSTVHANSPLDALRRLSTLALFGETGLPFEAVCDQLRSAVEVIVQVARGAGGAREIVAVSEVVDDASGFAVHALLQRDGGRLRSCGRRARQPRRVSR